MQVLRRLKNPLFVALVSLQIAGGIVVILLSIQFLWFGFPKYFAIYVIPQITVGIAYLMVDFNKQTRGYFVAGTVVLAAIWIFMIFYAGYFIAVIDFAPYVPGKFCSMTSDPDNPYYCPELNDVANLMKTQKYSLMQATLIGFLPSIALPLVAWKKAV
jgi:hypothetical protein